MVQEVVKIALEEDLGIEVQSFYSPAVIGNPGAEVAKHRELVKDIGFKSLHGPYMELNPGSSDPLILKVVNERLTAAYEVARKLDINHIVFHSGFIPNTKPEKFWVPAAINFWRSYLTDKDPGMNFYIENHLEPDCGIISDLLAGIDRKNVYACLDIGHANFSSKTGVVKWVEALGGRIGYVHMHNNDGVSDQHLGLETGTIPMGEVCAALEKHCPEAILAIETEPGCMRESVKFLKQQFS